MSAGRAWLAAVCTVLGACGGGEEQGPLAGAEPAAAAAAMCREHGVLEAVCTRCKPKLAAVFKAKGDWCAEHEFPESLCPTCHPERGGRPVMDVSVEASSSPDGARVMLRTPAAIAAAGIEVVAAGAPEPAELELLATLAYDGRRRAEVNARLSGVVRELLVDVGAQVTRDAPLVRIESAELGALQAELRAARARFAVAEGARQRAENLLAKGMAADKDLEAAHLELEAARCAVDAGEAALGLLALEEGSTNIYVLRAPLAGIVVRHSAPAGRMVEAGELLCEVVDVSTLWAELDVPELELARVASGLQARVTLEALPGREYLGTLDHLAPEVDARTRTARARVRLANEDGQLRANLFGRARLALSASEACAMVPLEALQEAEGIELVFVQLAADRYEARRVTTGARHGERVEILSGLAPGTPVATIGSFLLKTEVLKESIGAGCCEVE